MAARRTAKAHPSKPRAVKRNAVGRNAAKRSAAKRNAVKRYAVKRYAVKRSAARPSPTVARTAPDPAVLTVREFQRWMESRYGDRDRARGIDRTFGWFVEEVGEVSRALRKGTRDDQEREFADAFAWLVSVANLAGIDVADALARCYGAGCPKCSAVPCRCKFIA